MQFMQVLIDCCVVRIFIYFSLSSLRIEAQVEELHLAHPVFYSQSQWYHTS